MTSVVKDKKMGDILIPKRTKEEPFSERWGLRAAYSFGYDLPTFISPGGMSHNASLDLDLAEDFKHIFPLSLNFSSQSLESKIFDGTTTSASRMSGQVGFGRLGRSLPSWNGSGDLTAALLSGSIPMIGGGQSTASSSDRTLDGDTFSSGSSGSRTFDIGSRYMALGEIRPWGRGPALYLGPELMYGVQYAGENSVFNRLNIELRIVAGMGYGDASTRDRGNLDVELGGLGKTQGFYQWLHTALQRYAMAKVLSDPAGELGGGGTPQGNSGAFVNKPMLEAVSPFAGALSSPLTPALKSGSSWFFAFAAAQAAVAGSSFAYGSRSASVGGVTDFLGIARLMTYPIAGISTPSERLVLGSKIVDRRETYINLGSFALNTGLMLAGALVGSDTMARAGENANIQIAGQPEATQRGSLVDRTDVTISPYTIVRGERSGNRGAVNIHKGWRNSIMFSSLSLISPQLTPGNMGNHITQDGPYSSDSALPTDIDAALGVEWRTTWTRMLLGLDTKAIYGGGDNLKAGIGMVAGFDLIIPFNGRSDGSGLTIGTRALVHKLFPQGYQVEFMPTIGATIYFSNPENKKR